MTSAKFSSLLVLLVALMAEFVLVKNVYASDFATDMERLRQGIPLGPDVPTAEQVQYQELLLEIGKNMTYDRVIELTRKSPGTCLNWSDFTNLTLKAECEFATVGGGYKIVEEHEARLEAQAQQSIEDRRLEFFEEMGLEEKIQGVLDKCKNQSIANASVLELVECIDFIETYAESTIN